MAELYTPTSVSTGIDRNSEFLLKLDTQQRYNNIMNGVSKPMDYKLPNFTTEFNLFEGLSVPQIMDTKVSQDSIKKGLSSADPETNKYAWDTYNKNLQNSAEGRGAGGMDFVKAEDWQNKYKNDTFGFNPNLTQQENEQFYYENQYQNKSWLNKRASNTGKFLGRTLTGAALKLGQGLGYVGGMAVGGFEKFADVTGNWLGEDHTFMQSVADNALARYLEKVEIDSKDSATFSIYKPNNWDKKGFFEKLSYGNFWSDEVADGAAFLVSAMVPGLVIGKVGKGVSLLGKSANVLNKYRNMAQKAVGLETLGDAGSVIYSTVSESAFEGAEVYKTVSEKLKSAREKGENNYTDSDITKMAGEAAAKDFNANLGILGISNLFQNKFIFKPILNKITGRKGSFVAGSAKDVASHSAMDEAGKLTLRETSKNLFGKFVGKLKDGRISKFARLPFYGGRIATSVGMEGFWEENAQLAAERVATNSMYYDDEGNSIVSKDGFLSQYFQQTKDMMTLFGGKGDSEAATSVGLGGILGVVGAVGMTKAFGGYEKSTIDPTTGQIIPGKVKFGKGERKSELEAVALQVDKYNQARLNFLSTHDIYERDDKGDIKYDESKVPIINKAKVAEKLAALHNYGFKQLKAEQIEDPIFRNKLQKDLFSEYMASAIRAGVDERLVQKLEQFPNKNPEDIKAIGFDPVSIKTDVTTLVNQAKSLVKIYNDIYSKSSRIQEGSTFDDYEGKEELRKYNAYLLSSRALSSKDAYEEHAKNILEKQQAARPTAFAPDVNLYDAQIHEYNALQFERKTLEVAKNEFKDMEYTLLDKHIKDRLKYIEDKQKSIKESLDTIPEAKKEIVEEEGHLVSKVKYFRGLDDKMKVKMDFDQYMEDSLDSKRRAELSIDSDFNQVVYEALINKNKGLDNYDAYRNYLAKNRLLDEQADQKVEEDTKTEEAETEELTRLNTTDMPWETETTTEVVTPTTRSTTSEVVEVIPTQAETNSSMDVNESVENLSRSISPEDFRNIVDEGLSLNNDDLINRLNDNINNCNL